MNSHKCINVCSPNLHKDIKCYLHSKSSLVPLSSHSRPQRHRIIIFSSHRLAVSLLGLQINGIIQYGLFCVRPLSFNMFLRFIHVSAACSFLLLSSILSSTGIHHSSCMYFPTDGHLGSFQYEAF